MADSSIIEIPDRPVFKAAEVCELVKVQPYVLRTWEAEFPELGEAKATGSGRIYRRNDVERVLKIKHLLLVEGLTLAGARRRMEQEENGESAAAPAMAPAAAPAPASPQPGRGAVAATLASDVRERIRSVKNGLQSLLEMLGAEGAPAESRAEFSLEPQEETSASRTSQPAKAGKGGGEKAPASPKRKRSS